MPDALVIAGCLSGEKDDAGVTALVDELAAAVGFDELCLVVTSWPYSLAELPAVRALVIKHAMLQRDCPFVTFARKELA